MLRIAAVLAAALLLASCTGRIKGPEAEISTPSVKIEGPSVTIGDDGYDDEDHEGKRKGKFCPPGQAKKNRC